MRTMIARWFERIRIGRANSYLKVCLFICMLLSVSSVKASSFTVNGVSYETISDTTCKVVAGDEAYEGMVNIPSEVSNNSVAYKVTSIGDKAFLNCNGLMDVTLPESLEEIGSEAFGNCYALTVISIPDNVKRIDKSAFIGTNLQDLYIGDCINIIGMSAFSFVPSVHLTSSISKINDVAFEDADNLRDIYIPSSVKEIESNAFAFCGNIQGVYIDDLANWCEIKFGNQYANPISKSRGIVLNGEYLYSIYVPDGVETIKDYAFYGCKYVSELHISDSVKEIGRQSFKECDNLSDLYFGKGLRFIGEEAFREWNINRIYTNDINSFCQINVFDNQIFNPKRNSELICNGQVVTKIELADTVSYIGDHIFCQYAKLNTLSMSNSVKTLGKGAFAGCENLMKAVISDSIKVIPSDCFEGCPLIKFNFPSQLEEIGDYAFFNLSLKKIVLPSTVVKMGEGALRVCSADSIILSDNITDLKNYTFEGCENLKYIYLGNSMQMIDGSCFCKCKNLSSIALPESMEKIYIDNYQHPDIKEVYCHSRQPYEAYFPNDLLSQAILYVPQGCKSIFENDSQWSWSGFKDIIEMESLGAVDEINANFVPNIPIDIYEINGKYIGASLEDLKSGIYVLKHGVKTKKILIK